MGKSLFPDDVVSACEVEKPDFSAGPTAAIEVLRRFKARLHSAIADRLRGGKAADYSTMKYEELRRIADNDAIADAMSEGEYESLSAEMWRKFSLEQGLR